MKYSSLVKRIAGESAEVWDIHEEGRKRLAQGEDVIMLSIGEESDQTTPASIQQEACTALRGVQLLVEQRRWKGWLAPAAPRPADPARAEPSLLAGVEGGAARAAEGPKGGTPPHMPGTAGLSPSSPSRSS